jgi:hypothetical protein
MSAAMSDEKPKPAYEDRWTVRGVGAPERAAAARMADKAGQTMGEWLTQAIRDRIQVEKAGTNVPTVVRLPAVDVADNSLDTAERVAEQVRGLAAAGVPISERQAAKVVAALNRCLPPAPKRQTKVADGITKE